MRVLAGCEQFGKVREAFRARGHDAWSCDLKPTRDGSSFHIHGDVLSVLGDGWDLAIFHPDCTYLTNSAEWAYKDPDFDRYPGVGYHQKLKPGTLFGAERRKARSDAVAFVMKLLGAPIPRIAIENPIGHLTQHLGSADQTIHPHQFGDDASKATCLWLKNLPKLTPTNRVPPRMVDGKPRWGNQTDGGQNKLPPSADRAMLRAATYPGIAAACADQWGKLAGYPIPMSPLELAMPFISWAVKNAGAAE
ncbi:MAG: hypothetical protein V4477_17085 [Pseudomonadota bacterium]